jgi:MSHA pilin protein MshD
MFVRNSTVAKSQMGFSLVELIAGIVILAMGMTALTSIIYPNASKSIDPIYQVRAAELAQSLLNEIMGKAFDERSRLSGGLFRCDESGFACTDATLLGAEASESSADKYDDVDDYDGYDHEQAKLSSGGQYETLYSGFTFSISVFYDGNYDGVAETSGTSVAKRIEIAITTPTNTESVSGQTFKFAAYKANY